LRNLVKFIILTCFFICWMQFGSISIASETTAKKDSPDEVTNMLQGNEDYYSIVGFALMSNEQLGFLKRGLSGVKIIEALGRPERLSKLQVMAYDGEKHQTWDYKTKGIQLEMIGSKNKQEVDMIKINRPCDFKTKRNIGVGSKKEDVLIAYKKEISLEPENPDTNPNKDVIIAGTIYGGIFFYIKNNQVSSIFIGSGAE